jgi:hypothetical protein
MTRRAGAIATAALIGATAAAGLQSAAAAGPAACVGDLSADSVTHVPGRRLRFGITPLAQAGQVGARARPPVNERVGLTDAALARLRPPGGRPFVVRLNRLFWSDRRRGLVRYAALARRFARQGYLVEIQLRYHPDEAQEGRIGDWTEYVRHAVRRFGRNPSVVGLQVTNEVNFPVSADSSDGAYRGAEDALVQGVIAAGEEVRRRGLARLTIGFNWFYRLDPFSESRFWSHIRDSGGRRFLRALDWIGLDAYPGTFFLPLLELSGPGEGMLNAMSAIRCYARFAGIPDRVPMHIEENGWPTAPPIRPYSRQASFLRGAVRTVDEFRGAYNVSDYRWFNLRDADTSSGQLGQHYGLMDDRYREKPAFEVYRRLVAQRSRR